MVHPQRTRVLFLDDSGNPSPRDASEAVVIGGFSIPSGSVPKLERRIAGAKKRFFPSRGDPARWELKATRTLPPNAWRRSKNRQFLDEALRILGQLDCTVYTVSIDKRRQRHPLKLDRTVTWQLKALVEHFSVECARHGETGLVVSDWSNQPLDAKASQRVAGYVITHRLPLHASIYYANSRSSQAVQVADLVAAVRRRSIEGDTNLRRLDSELAAIRTLPDDIGATSHTGRPYTNRIVLI